MLAVTRYPGHSDDLTGVHRQIDVVQRRRSQVPGGADLAQLQRNLPLRLRRALFLLGKHHITADHHSRQLTGVRIPGHHGADHLPPSQYGDPVRDRHHLFELVRDEDDGALLRRHQPKRLEEVIRLLGRELRGRLVEDQDAGAAIQDLEDLDALLLTD